MSPLSSSVSIVRVEDVFKSVEKAIEAVCSLESIVKPGDTVLIKPNVCAPKHPSSGVVADPRVAVAVALRVREAGATPIVGESPIASFDAGEALLKSRFKELCEKHSIELIPFDYQEGVYVSIPRAKALKAKVKVAKVALESSCIISVPALKAHHLTKVTLSLKNMKGIMIGKEKLKSHVMGLDASIVDLNRLFKPKLSVVSGLRALRGGPTSGEPIDVGVVVAGLDPVAVDSTLTHLMGLDPRGVGHIWLAHKEGLGEADLKRIEVHLGSDLLDLQGLRLVPIEGKYQKLVRAVSKLAWLASPFLRSWRQPKLLWREDLCLKCWRCVSTCPRGALGLLEGKLVVDQERCVKCCMCIEACPAGALMIKS